MPMQRRGRYHASAKERTMLLRCESLRPPMSQSGLGCAKTLAVAPHVEISPGNCIPESQIILHTRGSMPCWRIVFSTFCGCMSFYTGSVRLGHGGMSALSPFYAQLRTLVGDAGTAASCRYCCKSPKLPGANFPAVKK